MYESEAKFAGQLACSTQNGLISKGHISPTLSQNIDNRIAAMTEQVERLKKVKATLERGSILDVPLDDLRFAMNY